MKAIVLGGGHDQVPLVLALKNKGYYVVLIDYYENPNAKEFVDKHYQISTLDRFEVDKVVRDEEPTFVTSLGNDPVLPVIAEVSYKYGLPTFYSFDIASAVTNKRLMRRLFEDLEICIPKQVVLLDARALAHFKFPVVIKPIIGTSSRGVKKLESMDELIKITGNHINTEKFIVEEFIKGIEVSVDCFVVDGACSVLLVTRLHQVPGLKSGFSFLFTEFPYKLSTLLQDNITAIARSITDGFEIKNGPFFFQAKIYQDEIYVLEMGARIAGGFKFETVKITTGFNMVNAQIDLLEGKHFKISKLKSSGNYAQIFIYALKGTIGEVSIPKEEQIVHCHISKQSGDFVDGGVSAKDRIALITIRLRDSEDLQDQIKSLISRTKVFDNEGIDILNRDLYYSN
jgi:carbamoylphosphate synthase large subunit